MEKRITISIDVSVFPGEEILVEQYQDEYHVYVQDKQGHKLLVRTVVVKEQVAGRTFEERVSQLHYMIDNAPLITLKCGRKNSRAQI